MTCDSNAQHYISQVILEELIPGVRIQDGAIIADKIAANAVTADKVLAGEIDVIHLKALSTSGSNLVIDGETLADPSAWEDSTVITGGTWNTLRDTPDAPTVADVVITTSPPTIQHGRNAIKYTVTATDAHRWVRSKPISISPTKEYVIDVWARKASGTHGSQFHVEFFNTAGGSCGSAGSGWLFSAYNANIWGINGTALPSGWTYYKAILGPTVQGVVDSKIPPTAVTMQLHFGLAVGTAAISGVTYLQRPRVQELIGGVDIADGVVEGRHLIGNFIIAKQELKTGGTGMRVQLSGSASANAAIPLYIGAESTPTFRGGKLAVDSSGNIYLKGEIDATQFTKDGIFKSLVNTNGGTSRYAALLSIMPTSGGYSGDAGRVFLNTGAAGPEMYIFLGDVYRPTASGSVSFNTARDWSVSTIHASGQVIVNALSANVEMNINLVAFADKHVNADGDAGDFHPIFSAIGQDHYLTHVGGHTVPFEFGWSSAILEYQTGMSCTNYYSVYVRLSNTSGTALDKKYQRHASKLIYNNFGQYDW